MNPMTFQKAGTNIEIFFDNSNQIEVYKGKISIGSYYLQKIEDLIKLLQEI